MIEVVVKPAGQGRYEALVDGRSLFTGKEPFFGAARVLQKEGVPDDTALTMRHEGSATVSFRTTVGRAAGLSVHENEKHGPRIVKWVPFVYGGDQGRQSEGSEAADTGEGEIAVYARTVEEV